MTVRFVPVGCGEKKPGMKEWQGDVCVWCVSGCGGVGGGVGGVGTVRWCVGRSSNSCSKDLLH